MEDIFVFIDSFALDEHLQWQLQHAYKNMQFSLEWHKTPDLNQRWRLRLNSSEQWAYSPTASLLRLLGQNHVDLNHAKRQLGATIITQAVYASLVVEAAEKLFGKETLVRAFADTNQFLANVLKATQDCTQPQKPSLKIIATE